MEHRRVILSVKPHLARALVEGEKRVEFRRTRPAFGLGDVVYVYATSPVQSVVGAFTCGAIVEAPPTALWREYANDSEVTRAFFRDYFNGSRRGYAIEVREPQPWSAPVSLDTLREIIPGFQPPRSYRFLSHTLSDGRG